MASATHVLELIRMFAPIVIGVLLIIAGMLLENIVYVGLGAGMLGAPGIGVSVKGVKAGEADQPTTGG